MADSIASSRSTPPYVPEATTRLPTVLLWLVPFLLVLAYVFLVNGFFHAEARWTGDRLVGVTVVLLGVTALLSFLWFGVAYGAALLLGEFVPYAVLGFVARIPGIQRHVIVTPPAHADTPRERWGRFGILLLVTLGFEVIFLILIVQRGDLAPNFAIDRPFRFYPDEALAGLGLAVLLAPVGPLLASRVRTRITDSLEFPLLWLAALLLILGGVDVLALVVFPGFVFDPALFLTSLLLYAPAAWYVSLAFVTAETRAQRRFLRRAWRGRGGRFHFGRLRVVDEPDGTVTDV